LNLDKCTGKAMGEQGFTYPLVSRTTAVRMMTLQELKELSSSGSKCSKVHRFQWQNYNIFMGIAPRFHSE